MKPILFFLFVCLMAGFTSCSDEIQNTYSRSRASFLFKPTTAAAPLQAALNSYGEYCDIRYDASKYYFTSLNASYTYTRSAVDIRNQTISMSNGFIVGRSSLTDMGSDKQPIVCYDRVCPNCFRESYITRALTLKEGGLAFCSRCTRTYDLNNLGIISSDTTGVKLERYSIAYGNNTLAISN
ncbi:MAG: hypothetical protein RR386_07090 [Bacteroidaceae bacterium]